MTPEPVTLDIVRRFAPGTVIRDAVDLILRQGTGALVLMGSGPAVDSVSSGGFDLAATPFTAQRLAELAKMDGGIVVDEDLETITRANVHFIPDPSIETEETGTRFRTAERLANQTGKAVLAVSEEGRSAAIVFTGDDRYELQNPTVLLAQANQGLNSLERLRRRLDEAVDHLTRFEVDDEVTFRDVVLLLQRAELLRRLGDDVHRISVELGGEAHLIGLQATDLGEGVGELMELVYADYAAPSGRKRRRTVFDRLSEVATEELYDTPQTASALDLSPLDEECRPRGLRALARVPRLPDPVKESLLEHFGDFQKLLRATVGELDQVDGVGRARAQQLRSFFDRLLDIGTVGHHPME